MPPVPALPFPGVYPPPPPTRPRGKPVAVVVVVALALVAFAGATLFLARERFAPRRTGPAETAEQKYRAAREAFAAGAPVGADPKDLAAIDGLLAQLGQALTKRQGARAASMFDFERMTEEILSHPGAPTLPRGSAKYFTAGLRASITQNFGNEGGLDGWTRHQVHRIQMLPGRDGEAVVFARHWDADGFSVRFRWWLRRDGTAWKAYDYEELTEGLRATAAVSAAAGPAVSQGGTAPWLASYRHVQAALVANAKEDYDAAEKSLRLADGVAFPAPFDAMRWTAWGTAHLGRGRFAESLAAIDKATAAAPGIPLADFLRTSAYLGIGDGERALASARRFDETLGADADNLHNMGQALEALGRGAEAAEAYRRGLDDDKDSAPNLLALALVAPADKKAEVGERFGRSAATRQQFEAVAGGLAEAGEADALRVLIDAYVAKRGADAASASYSARLKMGREEYDAAAHELRQALAAASSEEDKASLQELYLSTMRRGGKAVEAYREAPDRAAAFAELASQMTDEGETGASLRELVEARRADAPEDFQTHYHDGIAHEGVDAYPAAEAAYARAAAAAGDEAQLDALRNARVYVRYKLGRGLSALGEFRPADKTFAQLAWLYAGDADADGLEKLVATRRATDPADRELRRWDAEVKWLRKDYGAAADGFLEYHGTVAAESSVDDRLVRSLVRAGRAAEALPHAERYQRAHGESFYRLLALAAAGDVPAATEAFGQCVKEGYDPAGLYTAEDLEPLLESDAFAPFRAAHPRPRAPATSRATTEPAAADTDAAADRPDDAPPVE